MDALTKACVDQASGTEKIYPLTANKDRGNSLPDHEIAVRIAEVADGR